MFINGIKMDIMENGKKVLEHQLFGHAVMDTEILFVSLLGKMHFNLLLWTKDNAQGKYKITWSMEENTVTAKDLILIQQENPLMDVCIQILFHLLWHGHVLKVIYKCYGYY